MGYRKGTWPRFRYPIAALAAIAVSVSAAHAVPRVSWNDLDAPEARVYGSEKEAKYPINAFIVEREKWEDGSHSSFHVLWFLRGTDYPKYTSFGVLPFYYHLQSKVDNRERSVYFPLAFRQTDGEERITLTPLSLFTEDASSWWHFYGWLFLRYGSKDNTSVGTVLFPLVFQDTTAEKSSLTIPALLRYEKTAASTTVVTPLFYSDTGEQSTFTISPAHVYSRTGETESMWGFPALPFLFFHSRDEEGSHWNALTLFDWGTRTDGSFRFFAIPFFFKGKDYLVVPPVYFDLSDEEETLRFGPGYYWQTTKSSTDRVVGPFWWSSSGEGSTFHIVPLLYNNWQPDESVSFSPLHSYQRRQEDSREVTTWGVPLIPILTYHSVSADSFHRNFLTIFDIAWKKGELERFWAVPLVFKGENYLVVPPLFFDLSTASQTTRFGPGYYWHTEGEQKERLVGPVWWSKFTGGSSLHVFPLIYNRFETADSLSFSPLHIYSADEKDSTWGVPLLPLLSYHSKSGDVVRRNFMTLVDLEWKKGRLTRLWTLPFGYYGADENGDSYGHVLPLYASFWGNTGSFSISPAHFYYSDTPSETKMAGFPVLPFLAYYNKDAHTTHRNFLTIFDISWQDDKWEHFWALPIVFKGRDYFALAPLYFDYSDAKETLRFGPGYYFNSTAEKARSFTPFHLYMRDTEGSETSTNWGVPLIPFLTYHTKTSREIRHNFLTLFDLHWTDNKLDRVWAAPFFLKGKGYLHVVPAYFSWETPEGTLGVQSRQISPLFVTWRDRQPLEQDLKFQDLFWAPILPLYFSRVTEDSSLSVAGPVVWRTGEYRTLNSVWVMPFVFWHGGKASAYTAVPPFYFRGGPWDAEEGRSFGLFHYHSWSQRHDTVWALLYYHAYARTAKQVLFPVYWSWDTGESSGDLILPLRFNYADGTKAVHINITGFSKSMQTGVVGTSVGEKEGRWYLDTEFSWLYDAFSTSIRVSTPAVQSGKKQTEPTLELFDKPEFADISQRAAQDEAKSGQPHLEKSILLSREDAFNYWSVRVLYGLVAYQHADTRRHFRVLPFYWLSWDERSDDKVYFIPGMFLSYQAEETEYFALIPLFLPVYGKQRQGKSFVESYGAILALREHNEEQKRDELSVLWPLSNFYETPEQSGSRIIPLYWHRSEKDAGGAKSLTVSLAYFRRTEDRDGNKKSLLFAPLLPLYVQSTTEANGDTSLWRSVIPLFLYHSTRENTEVYALPGIYWQSKPDSSYVNVLFGLFSRTANKRTRSTSALFSVFRTATEGNVSSSRFFPVYYSESTPFESPCAGERSTLFILPVYLSRVDCKSDPSWSRLTLLSPFFARFRTPVSDAWAVTLPFIYHSQHGKNPALTNFMLLSYWHTDDKGLRDLTLFPVFHWGSQRSFATCDGTGSTIFLPLIFYRYAPCSDPAQSQFTILSPLYTRWESGGRTRWLWTLPFVYRSSTPEETLTNFMFLSYWHSKEGSVKDFTVLPIFHWSAEVFVSPVYTRWKDESTTKYLVTVPFVYHVSRSDSSFTNFMLLSYWNRDKEGLEDFTVFPLVHWSAHRTYADCEGSGSKTFSPLHYYRSSSCADGGDLTVVSPLYTRWKQGDTTRWFTTIPFVYHKSVEEDSLTNFMGLIYWNRDQKGLRDITALPIFHLANGETNRLYLFPFYRSQDENETYFHIMPVIWSVSNNERWSAFAMGLYLRSSPTSSRQNFLYLFDHESYEGHHSVDMALGAISFNTNEDHTRFKLLYGLAASARFSSVDTSIDYLLWMGSVQNSPEEFHSRLLPLYYTTSTSSERSIYTPLFFYNRDEYATRFVSLPFYYRRTESELSVMTMPLFYYNRSEEQRMFLSIPWVDISSSGSVFQLGLLGSAYYRNYNAAERTDRRMALLGILYNDVQRPERGYRSRGSLWGLLWEYETEEENRFTKFSLLKFAYSRRTEIDGSVHHRILGISF